jgi:hypothetical protein
LGFTVYTVGQLERTSGGSFDKEFLKAQGIDNSFRLSAAEPRHLVELCLAEDNNPLFVMETFITLSRVHEVSI